MPAPLEFRPLDTSAVPQLARWHADEVFCAHAGWQHFPDAERSMAVARWERLLRTPHPLLIRHVASERGVPVGYIDLYGSGPRERELGFLVGPSSRWNRGYGLRIAHYGVEYGFSVLGLTRIWAEAASNNAASLRILRTLGMRYVATGDDTTHLGRPARYLQFEIRADPGRK